MERKTITDLFIRTCKDSGFQLPYDQAAALTAGVLKISPMEVWVACGTLDTMQRIATGEHPACQMRENAEAR